MTGKSIMDGGSITPARIPLRNGSSGHDPEQQVVGLRATIVIPTFRRPAMLARAVESCMAQEGLAPGDYDILVVDNAPEGSAEALVADLDRRGPVTISYLHVAERGVSPTRNAGLATAEGEFVAFLDDDEWASPRWLSSLLAVQEASSAQAVLGPVEPWFGNLPATSADRYRCYFTKDAGLPSGTPLSSHWYSTCNCLIRRRPAWRTAGPFDLELGLTGGGDTHFFMMLADGGGSIVWSADALVYEEVPPERARDRFLLRLQFEKGQRMQAVLSKLEPPRHGSMAAWMLVGAGQVALYGLLTTALWPVASDRALKAGLKAAHGAGKVLWFGRLRRQRYGLKIAAGRSPRQAAS
jgi:hypothetical protein